MLQFANAPAFWGFLGSLIYASGRLGSVRFGEARLDPQAVKRAYIQFAVAIIFGPAAAQALGPTIMDWISGHARPQAVDFVIGLSVNAVWPTIEQVAWPSILAWFGKQLQSAGAAMAAVEPDIKLKSDTEAGKK